MAITITKSAWSKIGHIILQSKNKYGFLYSCSSGGCNGFNFELNLLEEEYYKKIVKNKFLTILKDNSNSNIYIDFRFNSR